MQWHTVHTLAVETMHILPAKTRNWLRDEEARDDSLAIGRALSLCAFLWLLKVCLGSWYLFSKGIHPLADAPAGSLLILGGADLILCAFLAVVYWVFMRAGAGLRQPLRIALRTGLPLLIHVAVVLFCTVSYEVNQVYGAPLEIEHLRSADDPAIIRASAMQYASFTPIALIVVGIACFPILSPALAGLVRRWRWLRVRWRLWGVFLSVSVVMFLAWSVRLKGIDTWGVKQNAIVHFIRRYQPPMGTFDAGRRLAELEGEVAGHDAELAAAPSLISGPGTMLQRDFAFDAIGRGFNLIVIQMESTSAAHLDRQSTPNLMRLAEHGVSFRNHYTVWAETSKATYALYYSDYLADFGASLRELYHRPMPQPALAEALKQAGYRTGLFHSGFLSFADLRYLFEDKGFDTTIDARDLWEGKGSLPWSWGVPEEMAVEAMVRWIKQRPDAPFFALYATMYPHHPYESPEQGRKFPNDTWLNRYRNSLHYVDAQIGMLMQALEEQGLAERTIIAVVGDHGETVSTYPVGHGLAMTLEEMRTPFILSNPRLFPAPAESRMSSNHLDFAPTLLAALGVASPDGWLGRNLLAEEVPNRLLFVTMAHSHLHGIVDGNVEYVVDPQRRHDGLFELSAEKIVALPANDPRLQLLGAYRKQEDLFHKWAMWRHLRRAVSASQPSQ